MSMMSSVMSMIKKDSISTNCVEFLEVIENSWCFNSAFTSNHSSPTQEEEEEEEEGEEEESVSHEEEKSVEKEVAWQLFQIVDEDKDGLVSAHEFLSFLSRIGLSLTLQGLHTMINLSKSASHSSNHNHNHNHDDGFGRGESATLTFHDFHSLCIWAQMEKMEGQMEERAEEREEEVDEDKDEVVLSAFRVFDRNGDGFISAEELRNALVCMGLVGRSHELGIEECQKLIEKFDRDANGLIDLSEFKKMLSSHSSLPCTVSA